MKTLTWMFLLLVAGAALGLAALAGCDRNIGEVNPSPVSEGQFSPGTVFAHIPASAGQGEGEEDVGGGGGGEDTTEQDTPVGQDTQADAFECTGSEGYCTCLANKDNDLKYDEYCRCMDSPSVPGGNHTRYCGCCVFASDPSFPEYENEWQFTKSIECDPYGYEAPCQFD
ncbi:MAG: hypothetical protein FJ098_06575 [Deltaproteobacteria bacterium]|nr:hypothetical protein [Deltaproteobacteria bacterium]